MAEKIGFITFNAFDGPSPTEYEAYKKLERRLEPYNRVKSLAETHPSIPPMRTEAPQLNRTPDVRIYKLAAELAPLMDEYHHHVLDVSRIKERIKYIERYRFHNDLAELKYYRHVDLLHQWITELLFERVYHRVGRYRNIFEKVHKHEWREHRRFLHEHREERVAEAKVFPELHQHEMVHPFRFEVKEPNEKKALQKGEEHIIADRHFLAHTKEHLLHFRRLMEEMLRDEIKMHLRHQFVERRNEADERSRWHMHDVLRAFDNAWMHAWDSKDTFRELIRKGIFEMAEYYPRLFRKAIRDPYEIEIREPNQKDIHQKLMEHIFHERQFLKLVKLEEEAERQLTRTHKLELEAYRLLNKDRLEQKIEARELENHILIERRDDKEMNIRSYQEDVRRAESQGYQLLAGRMVPQPKIRVEMDLNSRVPLPMGLHGDPKSPEHVAPTPMFLQPHEQRELWADEHKIRQEVERHGLQADQEILKQRTQVVRQNMAAIEYGEQQTKELLRPMTRPRPPSEPSLHELMQKDEMLRSHDIVLPLKAVKHTEAPRVVKAAEPAPIPMPTTEHPLPLKAKAPEPEPILNPAAPAHPELKVVDNNLKMKRNEN